MSELVRIKKRLTHLVVMQGTSERRTELYQEYGEGALELVTQQNRREQRQSFELRAKAGRCDE